MIRFADISGNNENLTISYLVGQLDGMMIKATEGTSFVSSVCDSRYQQCKKYGLKVGFYHYGRNNSAKTEADWFLKNCENYFHEGIPCLDWEEGQSAAWVNEFVERIHDETNVWPWVYANSSTFKSKTGVNENCGRWVAAWPKSTMTFDEAMEYGVRDLAPGLDCAWQFCDKGRLQGYSGNLDLDVFYGDKAAWDKYAKGDWKGASSDSSEELKTVLENAKYKVTIEEKK